MAGSGCVSRGKIGVCLSNSTGAVSYTHLDVYKRQQQKKKNVVPEKVADSAYRLCELLHGLRFPLGIFASGKTKEPNSVRVWLWKQQTAIRCRACIHSVLLPERLALFKRLAPSAPCRDSPEPHPFIVHAHTVRTWKFYFFGKLRLFPTNFVCRFAIYKKTIAYCAEIVNVI